MENGLKAPLFVRNRLKSKRETHESTRVLPIRVTPTTSNAIDQLTLHRIILTDRVKLLVQDFVQNISDFSLVDSIILRAIVKSVVSDLGGCLWNCSKKSRCCSHLVLFTFTMCTTVVQKKVHCLLTILLFNLPVVHVCRPYAQRPALANPNGQTAHELLHGRLLRFSNPFFLFLPHDEPAAVHAEPEFDLNVRNKTSEHNLTKIGHM